MGVVSEGQYWGAILVVAATTITIMTVIIIVF